MTTPGPEPADQPLPRRQLGQLRGTISISDDFDDTPPEVAESLNTPVNPAEAPADCDPTG